MVALFLTSLNFLMMQMFIILSSLFYNNSEFNKGVKYIILLMKLLIIHCSFLFSFKKRTFLLFYHFLDHNTTM